MMNPTAREFINIDSDKIFKQKYTNHTLSLGRKRTRKEMIDDILYLTDILVNKKWYQDKKPLKQMIKDKLWELKRFAMEKDLKKL